MPFVKTAFIDSKSAKIPGGSSGEMINHYGQITFRVTGVGNLDLQLLSQDSIKVQTLNSLLMQSTTERQPTKLCNFNQQRAQLKISTNAINEIFNIQRIILWVKPISTSYPM
jgi:hypothetical protein